MLSIFAGIWRTTNRKINSAILYCSSAAAKRYAVRRKAANARRSSAATPARQTKNAIFAQFAALPIKKALPCPTAASADNIPAASVSPGRRLAVCSYT